MTTEIIVKAYYRKNSDEETMICAPTIAAAVKDTRGQDYEEIDYVIEVEKNECGEVIGCRNVLAEFESEWLDRACDDLEEEWRLGAKLEYDGTLEAWLDRAEGPLLRRPSIRISRGFNATHVTEAAE